eukprot:scaffold98767_cov32-Tisochrysis_lutea.AAC.3
MSASVASRRAGTASRVSGARRQLSSARHVKPSPAVALTGEAGVSKASAAEMTSKVTAAARGMEAVQCLERALSPSLETSAAATVVHCGPEPAVCCGLEADVSKDECKWPHHANAPASTNKARPE